MSPRAPFFLSNHVRKISTVKTRLKCSYRIIRKVLLSSFYLNVHAVGVEIPEFYFIIYSIKMAILANCTGLN